jgi:hypothetical protein
LRRVKAALEEVFDGVDVPDYIAEYNIFQPYLTPYIHIHRAAELERREQPRRGDITKAYRRKSSST